MRKIVVFLLCVLYALSLCACQPVSVTDPPDTEESSQGTTETNTEQTLSTENTESTELVLPVVPQAQLDVYNTLFGNYGDWYNVALTFEFQSPDQLNLKRLFYNGFPGEKEGTDEEWAQLEGFVPELDFFRLPVGKMNEVLTAYFGVTLEDLPESCFKGLTHLESTNCYYLCHSDFNCTMGFQAVSLEEKADGSICVYYTLRDSGDIFAVTLMPNAAGHRILSNGKVK